MDLKINKCYFKDGTEMPQDYKFESIPELTELLDRVYSRIEEQKKDYNENNKKSSA